MTLSIEQISTQTRAGHIRDALIEKMLIGELPPGTRLKDNEVAKMFGTSTTPVREALRELEKCGLVEILPYRGCQVKQLDAEEIREIYEVRIAIEDLAAKRAATRINEAQLRAMAVLVDEYETALAAGDMQRAIEAGSAFHSLLVEASGNRTLLGIHRELHNRILLTRRIEPLSDRLPQSSEAAERPLCDHRAIFEALRRREPEQAARLLVQHIALGRDRVLQAMRINPSEPQESLDAF